MAALANMTVDELAASITREDLRESAQQIRRELAQIPFQVLQDKTAKYMKRSYTGMLAIIRTAA